MCDYDQTSILSALGGEAGCFQLARAFYARVAKSPELKPLFPGKSLRCATEEFSAFLIQFLDGDWEQTQYRWWLSLRESHSRFKITAEQRSAWLSVMDEAIHSVVLQEETRQALIQFFRATSAYILGHEDGDIEHRELKHRWAQQRTLDVLIHEIFESRDTEAIQLARPFASRPAIFVGILGRMMEAGRPTLVAFVVESLSADAQLAKTRFNGRTLLHLAAASACLPVVRHLIESGTDPDILDEGGHAPLHRVPGVGENSQRVDVVTALALAGAKLDLQGGANRSTPLHQAARFGDMMVAEALLRLGARLDIEDKNGLTPLDRARRCRKPRVTALFAAC